MAKYLCHNCWNCFRSDTKECPNCEAISRIYRIIMCGCGEEVVCSAFTNTCECGKDYNMSGAKLAPREQWGAETGEQAVDCLPPYL